MKTIIIALIISFSFVINIYAQKTDTKSKEILEKFNTKINSYSNMKIDFVFTMKNKKEDIDEKKEGSIYLKGDMFKLNIAGQEVYNDGATQWTYIEEVQEVQVNTFEPDEEGAMSPSKILTSYGDDHRSKFIKEDIQNNKSVYIIDLIPEKGVGYFKVRLIINKNDYSIISSSIYDKENNIYTYKIKKLSSNINIKDSLFKFDYSKHPEVEIVDMR